MRRVSDYCAVTPQQLEPICLAAVFDQCGDWTQPSAAPRIEMQKAFGTEDPRTRDDLRKAVGFGTRDARAVVTMSEEHRWRHRQRRGFMPGIDQSVREDHVGTPLAHRRDRAS